MLPYIQNMFDMPLCRHITPFDLVMFLQCLMMQSQVMLVNLSVVGDVLYSEQFCPLVLNSLFYDSKHIMIGSC